MLQVAIGIVLIICLLMFGRLITPAQTVCGTFKNVQSISCVRQNLIFLAQTCKKIDDFGGAGVNLKSLKLIINDAYKALSKTSIDSNCDYEQRFSDNYYVIMRKLTYQKDFLYSYKKLPHANGVPRLYLVCKEIVYSLSASFTDEQFKYLINAFCDEVPLTYDEIRCLKPMTDYCLLEYAAVLAQKITTHKNLRALGLEDAKNRKFCLNLMSANAYLYGMATNLDISSQRDTKSLLADNGIDLDKCLDNYYSLIEQYNINCKNVIESLRSFTETLKDEEVLALSPTYKIYESDKTILFKNTTTDTKELYLERTSFLAKKGKTAETAIATEAIAKSVSLNVDISNVLLAKTQINQNLYILTQITLAVALCVGFAFAFKGVYVFIMPVITFPCAFIGIRQVFSALLKPRAKFLPKVELDNALPTIITLCVKIRDKTEAVDAVNHLQSLARANIESGFHYCLLADFCDSSSKVDNSDSDLIDLLKNQYAHLQDSERFCILVRERVRGENGKFTAKERKRGALLDLNDLILRNNKTPFRVMLGDIIKAKYVIALDGDTFIDSAITLVQIMEHPYTRDFAVGAINTNVNPIDKDTYFKRLFAGYGGLNSYSSYIVNDENDIFSCGNYTGKGIYNVALFDERVRNALPENKILSHDFIEGAISACVNTPVYGLESFPQNFGAYLARETRWIRGDWQLLPYLCRYVKINGNRVKNTLPPIAKYHIFSCIISSMIPISAIIGLFLTPFTLGFSAIVAVFNGAITIVTLVIASPLCLKTYRIILRELFEFCALPTVAFSRLAAISVTLYRLAVKRNLLVWNTAAHYNGSLVMYSNIVVASALLAVGIVFNFVSYYILALVFLVAVIANRMLISNFSKPTENERLKVLAKKTWNFFNCMLVAENNYLPFDNIRVGGKVSTMTSPTNIAFALSAVISAEKFGFITKQERDQKLMQIVSTIEKLEKFHGIIYNWIDVITLEVLQPRYVSTVDAGNLLAALLLCKSVLVGDDCKRVNKLIESMDMRVLFHQDRSLFYIGFNESTHTFDLGHYDLLASEAALTYAVCIGCGKIPQSAYKALSRECVKYKGKLLFSWTGGAFEYLMSNLFLHYPRGTLLQTTAKNAVKSQRKYSIESCTPFYGVSEAQYNTLNDCGDFRYKAFGVPAISYNFGADTNVVASYAGILALEFDKKHGIKNYENMCKVGMDGEFGLYESYDEKPVKSYMAHHQGMILAALTNYLFDGYIRKKMHSLPEVAALDGLLSIDNSCMRARKNYKFAQGNIQPERVITPPKYTNVPQISMNSDGKLYAVIDNLGGIRLTSGSLNYYRYTNGFGTMLIAKVGGSEYSLTDGDCEFHLDRTIFNVQNADIYARTECFVMAGLNAFCRKSVIKNKTSVPLKIRISTYAEVLLSSVDVHRAYADMKIESKLIDNAVYSYNENGVICHTIDYPNCHYTCSKSNYFSRAKTPDFGYTVSPIVSSDFTVEILPNKEFSFSVFDLFGNKIESLKARCSFIKNAVDKAAKGSPHFSPDMEYFPLAAAIMNEREFLVDKTLPLNNERATIVLTVGRQASLNRFKSKLENLVKINRFNVNFNVAIIYTEADGYFHGLLDDINAIMDITGFKRDFKGSYVIVNAFNDEDLANRIKAVAFKPKRVIQLSEFTKENKGGLPPINRPAVMKSIPVDYEVGVGGYLSDGSYLGDITVKDTPTPWSNVIADEHFGTLITESGGGFTYANNSKEGMLTDFSQDCVLDIPSEMIILYEKSNRALWSVTKRPIKTESRYTFKHGFGYSEFTNNYNGLISVLREYIAPNRNAKLFVLTVTNNTNRVRNLDIMFAAKPSCSPLQFDKFGNVISVTDTVKNNTFYIKSRDDVFSYSYYAEAFMRNGVIKKAKSLINEGVTPFCALSVNVAVGANSSKDVVFCITTDRNFDMDLYETHFVACIDYFTSLCRLDIDCEDKSLKYLLKWLPYQTYSSRFNARAGFYQVGGAIGFRDQLQDCLMLKYVAPGMVRNHIINCASHQFVSGDVMHWWHAPNSGVRTKICDDRLFLPVVVADYIEYTADFTILHELAPYLEDTPFKGDAIYSSMRESSTSGTILEHCLKAIFSCEFADNELLKIGGGDWNDAMNRIGVDGNGSTVWGSMMLYYAINKILPYVTSSADSAELKAIRRGMREAVYRAWDGQWFRRAYTDAGMAIGSITSQNCKIDLVCQSFAAISGIADPTRTDCALKAVKDNLWDKQNNIIKLLSPPFAKEDSDTIGYIADYPQYVRENGGQYTHAAIWYAYALLLNDDYESGFRALNDLNPVNHAVRDYEAYAVEPYVISADIYAGELIGRGGWSYYTGSAAWYYVTIVEGLLGIKICGNAISINPRLPSDAPEFDIKIKCSFGQARIKIKPRGKGEWVLRMGKTKYNTNTIHMTNWNTYTTIIAERVSQ